MHVTPIYTRSPLRNFSYLISHGGAAFCIDPFDGAEMAAHIRREGLTLTAIINTHHHGDHTIGNAALAAATGAPIWCHQKAEIAAATVGLTHGQRLPLGGSDADTGTYVEVLDTPGHTMSHIGLLTVEGGKPKDLVAGDTIFNGGVGNCHNGGDPDALYETVQGVIAKLPDDVALHPGHDYLYSNLRFGLSIDDELADAKELLAQYPVSESRFIASTIGLEKRISLFFQTDEPRIQKLVGENTASDPSRATFLKLRQLRNRW